MSYQHKFQIEDKFEKIDTNIFQNFTDISNLIQHTKFLTTQINDMNEQIIQLKNEIIELKNK